MVHHDHRHDGGDAQPGGPDQDQGDTPDADSSGVRARAFEGTVDVGWLRPHTYRHLGHPRVSTIALLLLWIGLFILYLAVHPG